MDAATKAAAALLLTQVKIGKKDQAILKTILALFGRFLSPSVKELLGLFVKEE